MFILNRNANSLNDLDQVGACALPTVDAGDALGKTTLNGRSPSGAFINRLQDMMNLLQGDSQVLQALCGNATVNVERLGQDCEMGCRGIWYPLF